MSATNYLTWYEGNYLQLIEFDCVVNESIVKSSEVTQFPVEQGSEPSDGIVPNPDTFNIEVIISDLTTGTNSRLRREGKEKGWSYQVADLLDYLRLNGTRVAYITPQKSYEDVVVKEVQQTRKDTVSNSLYFNIMLQSVVSVSIKKEKIKKPATKSVDKMARAKVDDNKDNTVAKPPEIEKSIAASAYDGVTDSTKSWSKQWSNSTPPRGH
jgi:hypothetical protein